MMMVLTMYSMVAVIEIYDGGVNRVKKWCLTFVCVYVDGLNCVYNGMVSFIVYMMMSLSMYTRVTAVGYMYTMMALTVCCLKLCIW